MILDVFFQGQTISWPYLRNGGLIDVKLKESALVGYWV